MDPRQKPLKHLTANDLEAIDDRIDAAEEAGGDAGQQALSVSQGANNKSDTAIQTANAASQTASNASQNANTAKQAAQDAASKADTAGQTASTALKNANTANSAAAIADLIARAAFDSADTIALTSSGAGTFNFNFSYDTKPILRYMVFQPMGNMPVVVEAVEWIQVGGKYTGVKVQGYRSQKMGTQQPVSLTSLLGGVITGLNNLINIVSGFNPFGGTSFTGVEVHITARIRTLPTT